MNASFRHGTRVARPYFLQDLCFAERLVLWAMRLWGAGYRLRHSPDDVLAKAFRKAGLRGGRQCLEEFMVALTAGAARGIGLQCVCRAEITEDERLLLDVLRLSQRHVAGQATFLLEDVVTPAALPIAAVKAQALAMALNKANLYFPGCTQGITASAPTMASVSRGVTH